MRLVAIRSFNILPQNSITMKKFISMLPVILLCLVNIFASAQAPGVQWQKSYGGSNSEYARAMTRSNDGGLVTVGTAYSSDGDLTSHHGTAAFMDYWVIKTDSNGMLQWQKSLGGSHNDIATCVASTTDGGYIVGGASGSNDGDITGNHGWDNGVDYAIMKLDGSGNIAWEKTLGGFDYDYCFAVAQANDGGYVAAGVSTSTNGDVTDHIGIMSNCWIVKLNSTGTLQWAKSFGGLHFSGGSGGAGAYDIKATTDGGFVVTGFTTLTDGSIPETHGGEDCILFKIDGNGNLIWEVALGGSNTDGGNAVQLTSDGGYIVAGFTVSNDGNVTNNHGDEDCWVVKLDANRNIVWQKTLGGSMADYALKIIKDTDGGFVVAAQTFSTDGDVTGNIGANDYWVIKLDAAGNLLWQKSAGGKGKDLATDVVQTAPNRYAVVGTAGSNNGFQTNCRGIYDYWLIKLAPVPDAPTYYISTQPLSDSMCMGSALNVSYTLSGTGSYNTGNVFTAQLSLNGEGVFDYPGNYWNIGSITSTTSGTIPVTIPKQIYSTTGYLVRVASSTPGVFGTTNATPISITCSPPSGLSVSGITSTSATISWIASACAVNYRLQYKLSTSNPWTKVTATGISYTITGLSPSSEYKWKIKAKCTSQPSTFSAFSSQEKFTTPALREMQADDKMDVGVFPNPLLSSATIQFLLTNSSPVIIRLFSVEAKEIMTIADENFSEGVHEVNFNRQLLTAGIYFLQLKTNEGVMNKKVVIE